MFNWGKPRRPDTPSKSYEPSPMIIDQHSDAEKFSKNIREAFEKRKAEEPVQEAERVKRLYDELRTAMIEDPELEMSMDHFREFSMNLARAGYFNRPQPQRYVQPGIIQLPPNIKL